MAVTALSAAAARPGRPTPAGGGAQLAFLEAAFEAVRRGEAAALCTAPVSKAQVARALPGFVGHTEWLEARCRIRRSVMMLAGKRLRIALVTNHVAFGRAAPPAHRGRGSPRPWPSPTAPSARTWASAGRGWRWRP